MPTIDTTVSGASANAYCDQAFANDYLSTAVLNSDVWFADATTSPMKDAALMQATRYLDALFTFPGYQWLPSQALAWPRGSVRQPNSYQFYPFTSIPGVIQQAVAEWALSLLTRDRTAEPDVIGLGMSEAGMSGMSAKIDHNEVLPLVPRSVLALLQFVATPRGVGTGHSGSTPLIRT
jgi:hypothetical protein